MKRTGSTSDSSNTRYPAAERAAGGSKPRASYRRTALALTPAAAATGPAGPGTGDAPRAAGVFPMPQPVPCHLDVIAGQPVPDDRCSPGATNPAVSQSTIDQTISRSGWNATVRPPVAVTDVIKAQSARAYSIPVGTVCEPDHKIPLEVGGDPGSTGDVANLWFEPGPIPNPKDSTPKAVPARFQGALVALVAPGTDQPGTD